ncbi:hypothetical protein D3C87_1390460 [compost metagenome]
MRFQLRHQLAHFLDHIQRVGARGGLDADVHRRRAAKRADRVVVFRAHFHPRDITQQHAAVATDLERNRREGFSGFQFGVGVDAGDHVLAFHFASSGEEVVLAHGVGHIAGAEAETGEFHRVEPQAHGEHLIAENLRLGHARQGRQFWLDHP